jgi:hypothetical protein
MMIVLTNEDCARLGPDTLREILAGAGLPAKSNDDTAPTKPEGAEGMDFTGVADLSPDQVAKFMPGVGKETEEALRVIAEHGPIVDATLLKITNENYAHFQGRLTKRTRTITGDKDGHLITWNDDDWEYDNGKVVKGRYAVTVVTWQSLRTYFGLIG